MSRPTQPKTGIECGVCEGGFLVSIASDWGYDFTAGIGIGKTELSATRAAIRNIDKIRAQLVKDLEKLESQAK